MTYSPTNYDKNFGGKVAVVTGGASGIGRTIVEGLSYHGARVCVLDIDEDKAMRDVVFPLREKSLDINFYRTDVSDNSQVKRTIEKVVKEHGIPRILVNNAGIEFNDDGDMVAMDQEKADEILNTNLRGYLNMIREVVPHMVKNEEGRIVNISSVQGIQTFKPGTIYQVIKAGIPAMARYLAVEYARKGIRANTVSPGAIKTEGMGDARITRDGANSLRSLIPQGRRGHPEEVADAVLFLLSEKASYINGQNFIIDGGLLIHRQLGGFGVPDPLVENDPEPDLV